MFRIAAVEASSPARIGLDDGPAAAGIKTDIDGATGWQCHAWVPDHPLRKAAGGGFLARVKGPNAVGIQGKGVVPPVRTEGDDLPVLDEATDFQAEIHDSRAQHGDGAIDVLIRRQSRAGGVDGGLEDLAVRGFYECRSDGGSGLVEGEQFDPAGDG